MIYFSIIDYKDRLISGAQFIVSLIITITRDTIRQMGNEQPKKLGKVNKNQVEMAALKAKIHLELMRDRKSQEIIKGEKELVGKLNAKSRNRTEEALIIQRVVNGLKYSQAVNQLISYAVALRSQAVFLSQNVGNQEKLQPWLTPVHSLLYAADQLGLSSLNQFKAVMKALNDPTQSQKYINPEIRQMLSPTPTPYEVNIYVLEMSQRNNIELEYINAAGHKFDKNPVHNPGEVDKTFSDMEMQLAEQFQKQLNGKGHGQGGQGWGNQGGQGWGGQGNQGGQGWGDQGGQGGWGNQGSWGNPGNQPPQGGFGGNNGQGGFGGNQGGNPNYYDKPNNYPSNPYKGASNIHSHGPNIYVPSQVPKSPPQNKPKQLKDTFDDLDPQDPRGSVKPIYPSVNPDSYKNEEYFHQQTQPTQPTKKTGNSKIGQPAQKSPTISQIMRDFDIK